MKVTITQEALDWFKKEISLNPGYGIRFFGKVYGKTQVHDGFSIGMSVEMPENPMFQTTLDNLFFFVETNDDWFFKGYDLKVVYNKQLDEPEYEFIEV